MLSRPLFSFKIKMDCQIAFYVGRKSPPVLATSFSESLLLPEETNGIQDDSNCRESGVFYRLNYVAFSFGQALSRIRALVFTHTHFT